jgi:squalene synthase HpnC
VVTPHAYCEALARSHYENFPVASRLLPRHMRPHVAAVYAFARIADDIADEGRAPAAERIAALDAWDARLRIVAAGGSDPGGEHPQVFEALRTTISECRLPAALFSDLVSAFKQDVVVTRYATWADLLDYCRRSANPVGRLVLRIAGCADAALDAASDAVCTALQLTNFWQDLERDWEKGRVYVPADLTVPADAGEEDLAARRLTPAWRAALEEAGRRTRALFDRGRPVCDGVGGRLRWELRATWLGGTRILDKLEAAGYDVFTRRPALAAGDAAAILWGTISWRLAARPAAHAVC